MSRSRLSGDLRQFCWEGRHLGYAAVAAGFILICPLGVPVGLLLVLRRQKKRGELYSDAEGEGEEAGEAVHPKSHFLKSMFMQYAPHAYHFEVVHMVCRGRRAHYTTQRTTPPT